MADSATIFLSLASSIITAGVTTFFNRSKTAAEVAKIRAETDKIRADTAALSTQVSNVLPTANFIQVYYDSSTVSAFDFEVEKNREFDSVRKTEVGESARGAFSILNDSIINIDRSNTEGRFNLVLKKYLIQNVLSDYIMKDPTLSQQRKIQISCDIKALSNKKHILDFVLRQKDTYDWLAKETVEVTKNEWTTVNAYLRVSPDKDFRLKIYDRKIEAPSSVQIRNLKIKENF